MWRLVLSLVLFRSSEASAISVRCKDVNNHDVDWYIIYKASRTNTLTGQEYIYIDPKGKSVIRPPHSILIGPGPVIPSGKPTPPPYKPIDDAEGVLANTLRPMLSSVRTMPPSFGFLSYSDQPPGCSARTDWFGHSKGVVLGDSDTRTALWLTHSTPQFPFRRDQNNFWPDSGNENGQTFLCVSLPFSALQTVGQHLQNIRAFPFDYDLPPYFPKDLRDAANWVHSEELLGELISLKTAGNKDLNIMAKPVDYKAANGDLYVKLAVAFNSDMYVQTWGCQPKRDESFCETDKPQVMNVEEIQTDLGQWSTKQDHSKWGVTTKKDSEWTCFGDVNRAESQYLRWGGAVCIKDKKANAFFKKFAKSRLACRKRPYPCSKSNIFSEMELPSKNESLPLTLWKLMRDNLKGMLKYF